jgi:hypothetical protein
MFFKSEGQICTTISSYYASALKAASKCGFIIKMLFFFKKGSPGCGANPGSSDFVYYLIPSLHR